MNELSYDRSDYIGKVILVGITYEDEDGNELGRTQGYGLITRITESGIFFEYQDEEFSIPPDLSALEPAGPGIYQLKDTDDQVENPDFVSTWTLVTDKDAEQANSGEQPASGNPDKPGA